MRVLLIHRYFWPDSPPYASMLRVIAGHLAKQGHEVTVLTTQPSYTKETSTWKRPRIEEMEGFRVVRKWMFPESKKNWPARLANVLLFLWHIACHILMQRKSYNLVTASTMPPVVTGAVAGTATRIKGGNFLYHCMDLYPEIATLSGSRLLGRGVFRALLAWLDRRTCEKAWRVVVLSADMRQALLERGVAAHNLCILNNFALESEEEATAEVLGQASGALRVLFAGNIGRFQGLETVIEAAHLLPADAAVEFHFLGDGAARASLEQQARELHGNRVQFHGFRPLADALGAMGEADLGIVSLQEGIVKVAFPSKTMTYLAAGLPILAMVEAESALARIVRNEDVGIAMAQGDAQALADAVLALSQDEARRLAMRENARSLGVREFSPEAALARWDELLGGLEQSNATMKPDRDPDPSS